MTTRKVRCLNSPNPTLSMTTYSSSKGWPTASSACPPLRYSVALFLVSVWSSVVRYKPCNLFPFHKPLPLPNYKRTSWRTIVVHIAPGHLQTRLPLLLSLFFYRTHPPPHPPTPYPTQNLRFGVLHRKKWPVNENWACAITMVTSGHPPIVVVLGFSC